MAIPTPEMQSVELQYLLISARKVLTEFELDGLADSLKISKVLDVMAKGMAYEMRGHVLAGDEREVLWEKTAQFDFKFPETWRDHRRQALAGWLETIGRRFARQRGLHWLGYQLLDASRYCHDRVKLKTHWAHRTVRDKQQVPTRICPHIPSRGDGDRVHFSWCAGLGPESIWAEPGAPR